MNFLRKVPLSEDVIVRKSFATDSFWETEKSDHTVYSRGITVLSD